MNGHPIFACSDKMPNCVAIKMSGETCGRTAVVGHLWNVFQDVPAHLHFCGLHHRTYQVRVAAAGHHVAGRCHYYANQHWCDAAATDGNLCAHHVLHYNALRRRNQVRAEREDQVRLLRVELLNEQPPRPWRAIVDDLVTRNMVDDDLIRYRAGMEVYIIREEGPRFMFNNYWNWVAGGRRGPEPGLEAVILDQLLPGPEVARPDRALQTIARDAQNVHTQVVSRQTNAATEKLLGATVPLDQQTEKSMARAWLAGVPTGWNRILATLNDVNTWFTTKTCRAPDDQLYRRMLRGLVAMINRTDDEQRTELYKRLWEECSESVGMCCEGHISRLCNVLVGFDDTFRPPVALGELMQQKMAAISGLDVSEEEKRRQATQWFVEHGVPEEERVAWLDAF